MIIFIAYGIKQSAIKVNEDVLLECERLKQNDFFSTVNRNGISVDTVTLLVHTVRLLPGHADDILSDNRIINNNIIGYTETRIKPWDSTCEKIETLNLFNINFNSNENKLLSLAFGRRNDVLF